MFQIDQTSVAYQHGYAQGLEGRKFRNPCSGNEIATNNHYFGFIKGRSERVGEGYRWGDPTPAWMAEV